MKSKSILISLSIVTLITLTMCGRSDASVAVQPTLDASITAEPSALPTPAGELDVPPTPIIVAPTLPVVTPDVYQSYPDYGLIIDYETKVADPSISESLQAWYQKRLEIERRAAEQRATDIASGPKTPIIQTPTFTPIGYIEPTEDVPRGIFDGYLPSGVIDVYNVGCTNMWQDVIGDLLVQIRACYTKADPTLAYLVLSTLPMDPMNVAPGSFTDTAHVTPLPVGPVRITAAQGTLLTLQNDDQSATFYFDAATRQYVNNLGTPVPVTPSPTQVAATPQAAP